MDGFFKFVLGWLVCLQINFFPILYVSCEDHGFDGSVKCYAKVGVWAQELDSLDSNQDSLHCLLAIEPLINIYLLELFWRLIRILPVK